MAEQDDRAKTPQIFSIGHSNQPVEEFLDLLRRHSIEVLVDVRSYPYSKFATQFDGPELKSAVTRSGLKYLYLGKQLGGRPADPALYDEQGRVEYGRLAETRLFQEGITRLLKGIESYQVAFMCTEEDPSHCHRHLLVSRVLTGLGVEVGHIRGDGQVQSEAELKSQPAEDTAQLSLFPGEEYSEWKSIRPVSPRKPPPGSSKA